MVSFLPCQCLPAGRLSSPYSSGISSCTRRRLPLKTGSEGPPEQPSKPAFRRTQGEDEAAANAQQRPSTARTAPPPWRPSTAARSSCTERRVECTFVRSRRRRHGRDADSPWRCVAATPRLRRGSSVESSGDAAAATRTFRSRPARGPLRGARRRRGRDVDGPWRWVAAAATWMVRGEQRRRRGRRAGSPEGTTSGRGSRGEVNGPCRLG